MKKNHIALIVFAATLAASFLGGCATQPPAGSPPSAEAFSKSMAEADQAALAGEKDRSIRLLQKVAADHPSRAEPWSRIAQSHFDRGNYGLAIVAAEETLRRDPSNRQAKSITAVGGLRLAARSLEDLRKDSSLNGDASADAQRLATLLRETLGTNVLVPAPTPAPEPASRARARARPTQAPAAAAAPAAAPAAPRPAAAAPRPSQGSGNPFDALK